MSVNLWLVEFFGGKKEELLILGIALFLRLSCMSMSNFNVLHSKLLINSKIIFLLLWIGSGKLSPSCNKHWTSYGMIVEDKLTSQFFQMISKEESKEPIGKESGSMLIFRLWHNFELIGETEK